MNMNSKMDNKVANVMNQADIVHLDIAVGELMVIEFALATELAKDLNVPEINEDVLEAEVEKLKSIKDPTSENLTMLIKICAFSNIDKKLTAYAMNKITEKVMSSIKEQVKEKENEEANA